MVTLKKLDIFWRHSNCPVRFKIQAVDAVVRSKLLYGMETAQLNEGELRRIEIVHLKILRKLKGMKTTFVNRNNTNREVYRRVNQAMENEGGKRKVVPFKRAYLRSKVKRMAKIVREEGSEGNKIFFRKGLEEWDYCNRRVGRPKYSWTKKALGELWGITKKRYGDLRGQSWDPEDEEKVERVKEMAKEIGMEGLKEEYENWED
jgi:hypothetical protein